MTDTDERFRRLDELFVRTGHSQSKMVQPLLKGADKVQKRTKKIKKFQSDRFKRLQTVRVICSMISLTRRTTREVKGSSWDDDASTVDPKRCRQHLKRLTAAPTLTLALDRLSKLGIL